MLPTAEIVSEVAELLAETNLPAPVIDPVMVSTSGHDLIGDEAFQILKGRLLRAARIVTPNIPKQSDWRVFKSRMRTMFDELLSDQVFGCAAVLIKGGHRLNTNANEAVDILLNERGEFFEFREEFVDVGEVHGSGCAAMSRRLAYGLPPFQRQIT